MGSVMAGILLYPFYRAKSFNQPRGDANCLVLLFFSTLPKFFLFSFFFLLFFADRLFVCFQKQIMIFSPPGHGLLYSDMDADLAVKARKAAGSRGEDGVSEHTHRAYKI